VADGKIREKDLRPEAQVFRYYIDAFNELSTCRPSAFDVGPIPFTAIAEYAKIFGVDDSDFHEFLFIIRAMDSEYLAESRKKQKAKPNGPNANKKH